MKRAGTIRAIITLFSLLLLSCSSSESSKNRNAIVESVPSPFSKPTTEPTPPSVPIPPSTPIPLSSPVPSSSPMSILTLMTKTNVRLRIVGPNGKPARNVAVAFVENANVNAIPAAVTDDDGKVSVDEVPCGKKIEIKLWEVASSAFGREMVFDETVRPIQLECGKSITYLGNIRIKCICPDCRPNRVIRNFTEGVINKPCKPEKSQ